MGIYVTLLHYLGPQRAVRMGRSVGLGLEGSTTGPTQGRRVGGGGGTTAQWLFEMPFSCTFQKGCTLLLLMSTLPIITPTPIPTLPSIAAPLSVVLALALV